MQTEKMELNNKETNNTIKYEQQTKIDISPKKLYVCQIRT